MMQPNTATTITATIMSIGAADELFRPPRAE